MRYRKTLEVLIFSLHKYLQHLVGIMEYFLEVKRLVAQILLS
jgi:hypothetical protein